MIVDPTLPSAELIYFPGLRFHGEPGLAKAIGIPKPEYTEDLPFFYRFGWGGIESPEFRAALIAAYRFVGCEALAQQYESYTPKPLTRAIAGHAVGNLVFRSNPPNSSYQATRKPAKPRLLRHGALRVHGNHGVEASATSRQRDG